MPRSRLVYLSYVSCILFCTVNLEHINLPEYFFLMRYINFIDRVILCEVSFAFAKRVHKKTMQLQAWFTLIYVRLIQLRYGIKCWFITRFEQENPFEFLSLNGTVVARLFGHKSIVVDEFGVVTGRCFGGSIQIARCEIDGKEPKFLPFFFKKKFKDLMSNKNLSLEYRSYLNLRKTIAPFEIVH